MQVISNQPSFIWVWPEEPHFINGHAYSVPNGPTRVTQWYQAEKFNTKEDAKYYMQTLLSEENLPKSFRLSLKDMKLIEISGLTLNVKRVCKIKIKPNNIVLVNNKNQYFKKGTYLYDSNWFTTNNPKRATKFVSIESAKEFQKLMEKYVKTFKGFKPLETKH